MTGPFGLGQDLGKQIRQASAEAKESGETREWSCRTCVFWMAGDEEFPKRGTCRRDPPQASLDRFAQPETSRWDFCGEWVERQAADRVRRGSGV